MILSVSVIPSTAKAIIIVSLTPLRTLQQQQEPPASNGHDPVDSAPRKTRSDCNPGDHAPVEGEDVDSVPLTTLQQRQGPLGGCRVRVSATGIGNPSSP